MESDRDDFVHVFTLRFSLISGNAGIIGENGPAPGSSLTSSIQNQPEATANVPPVKRPPNANRECFKSPVQSNFFVEIIKF